MPPPPPSVSPKPFTVASRFIARPNFPDQEDVFYTPSSKQSLDKGKERERAALGLIDTNHYNASAPGSASASTSRSGSKPPTVYHTSIPKPPLLPDVFTPQSGQKRLIDENEYGEERPRKRIATNDTAITTGNATRARDAKRERKDLEMEQERWRGKWIKSFPTLTFHFEVEAEQGIGKGLKARAVKMGAVSHVYPYCLFVANNLEN
jgi:hypothetical protein